MKSELQNIRKKTLQTKQTLQTLQALAVLVKVEIPLWFPRISSWEKIYPEIFFLPCHTG